MTQSGIEVATPTLQKIVQPYLLVLFSVPFHLDAEGRRFLDPLWAKDLIEHTRYIDNLILASPVRRGPLPANAVEMSKVEALRRVRCVELPEVRSFRDALRHLPRTWQLLAQASAGAALVHSAVAGWPLPEAWVLSPMLLRRRCIHYINVESAFWRLVPGEPASLKQKLRAWVTERLNRWSVGAADISTFTQQGYRSSLLRRRLERGHVVEASWIDADNILGSAHLAELTRDRLVAGPLRLVFVGRLTRAKGVALLLDAVIESLRAGLLVELDLFGDGPLAEDCAARLQDPSLARCIRLHGSVPYDAGFFDMLGRFHLLVVPALSDEQPRVVFDAYARGLPVLASNTAGLLQCVEAGVTGLFFQSGDAHSLAAAIGRAERERTTLTAMAPACLDRAARLTHQEMHRKRWRLLVKHFPALARV